MTFGNLKCLSMLKNAYKANGGQTNRQTNRQTDRPTDRPTDGVAYRVACTRLKSKRVPIAVHTIDIKKPSQRIYEDGH